MTSKETMDQTYRAREDDHRIEQIRAVLKELPQACGDFLRNISMTTSTLTRLAYAYDLRIFFQFLSNERVRFAQAPICAISDQDLASVSQQDLEAFVEYLTIYYKATEISAGGEPLIMRPIHNHELGVMRKLSTLRSFFEYLFLSKRLPSNVTTLVPLPKIHEKPILRLELDEISKMMDIVVTGESLSKGQQRFQNATRSRDYAMLSLLALTWTTWILRKTLFW